MKKTLFLTLMCLFGFLGLHAQETETITIGSGSGTTMYTPSYTYSYYTVSQQIYLAEEMQYKSGEITSLAFRCERDLGTTVTRNFKIYMLNTDKAVFNGDTDWVDVQESDLVYSGDVTHAAMGTWTVVNFDTPFVYQKGKNVLLCINDVTGTDAGAMAMKYASEGKSDNRCMYKWGFALFDATNVGEKGNPSNNLNQIQFTLIPGEDSDDPIEPEDPEDPEQPVDPEIPGDAAISFFYDFNDASLDGWRTFQGAENYGDTWQITPELAGFFASYQKYYQGVDNTSCLVSMAYDLIAGSTYKPDNYIVTSNAYKMTSSSKLSWYVKAPYSNGEYYEVVVSNDNVNWETVYSETVSLNDITFKEIDLSSKTDKVLYIGFRHYTEFATTQASHICIDDIKLSSEEIPEEPVEPTIPSVPQNLAATATGETTIALTWNAVQGATSYKVYYGEEVIAAVTTTSYTVEGLTAETNYCYSVTALNEAGESEKSAEACATTDEAEVVVYETSFLYDFNDGTINGWKVFQGEGATSKNWATPQLFDGFAEYIPALENYYKGFDGTTAVYSMSYYMIEETPMVPDNYIVTENVYMIEETSALVWDVKQTTPGKNDHYGVVVSTDGVNFEVVWHEIYSAAGEKKAISLSQYAGTALYVGFRHYDSEGGDALCIDNIELTLDPSVDPIDPTAPAIPSNLTATATGETTIVLSWNAAANALSYNVYQGEEKIANVTETTYTVEGLTASTNYCFSISSVKGEEETKRSEEACATTDDVPPTTPEAPANLTAVAASTSAITLTWDVAENATSYNIYNGMVKIASATETTYTVEGLEYDTEYCFTVTALNGELESAKSEEACTKTKGEGIAEMAATVNIYPNPVENQLFIETETNVEEISIYNVNGQQTTISSQQISSTTAVVNVENLNSGFYLVKVVTDNGEIVKRFVKK